MSAAPEKVFRLLAVILPIASKVSSYHPWQLAIYFGAYIEILGFTLAHAVVYHCNRSCQLSWNTLIPVCFLDVVNSGQHTNFDCCKILLKGAQNLGYLQEGRQDHEK